MSGGRHLFLFQKQTASVVFRAGECGVGGESFIASLEIMV